MQIPICIFFGYGVDVRLNQRSKLTLDHTKNHLYSPIICGLLRTYSIMSGFLLGWVGRYMLICLGKYWVSLDVLNWHIFRRLSNWSELIKIAKKSNSNSDDDELEKLVRKIRSEVRETTKPGDYNLSDYVRHKVIRSTSATLLNLVSSLVSGGAITKPPLNIN